MPSLQSENLWRISAAALPGAILRDLLVGAAPPASIADWRYAAIAFVSSATALLLRPALTPVVREVIVYLDAGAPVMRPRWIVKVERITLSP